MSKIVCLPGRYLIRNHITRLSEMARRLTLDKERTVDPPYAACDCYRKRILFINCDAGGLHECTLRGDNRIDRVEDVHADHKQQRSGGEGQVSGDLFEGMEHAKSCLLGV
jgi:hypothetical protein